jgi:hypothetical protein
MADIVSITTEGGQEFYKYFYMYMDSNRCLQLFQMEQLYRACTDRGRCLVLILPAGFVSAPTHVQAHNILPIWTIEKDAHSLVQGKSQASLSRRVQGGLERTSFT